MSKSPHILVIRLSAMGDVAMTVPVLRALVKQHPNVKITVLSKGFLQPLFEGIENVNFYTADVAGKHKGISGLLTLYNELKRLGITHVADLHNVLRSKVLRTYFKFSNYDVAFINKGRIEKKALTRAKNKQFKPLKTSMQRYVDVFTKLGFYVDVSNPEPIPPASMSKQIEDLVGKKTNTWIGIAPFAAFKSKEYPLDLMEDVIKQLSQKDYTILLFGGKGDAPELEKLADLGNHIISTAGQLGGLALELDLISNLDLMLSMDSGNAHLAAIQGVKTITLWGSTHPYAGFAPFNQPEDYCLLPDLDQYPNLPSSVYGKTVFQGYEDAMRSIAPDNVVGKIKEVI